MYVRKCGDNKTLRKLNVTNFPKPNCCSNFDNLIELQNVRNQRMLSNTQRRQNIEYYTFKTKSFFNHSINNIYNKLKLLKIKIMVKVLV